MNRVALSLDELKQWAGVIVGALGAGYGMKERMAKSRSAAIDARILETVNPPLIHERLTQIVDAQSAMNEKVDGLVIDVAKLQVETGRDFIFYNTEEAKARLSAKG